MKAKTIFTALLVAASAAVADNYQFIVSGYPAANVSYSAASSGTSLVAGPQDRGRRRTRRSDGMGARLPRSLLRRVTMSTFRFIK